jgi:hypothetical protein
MGLIWMVVNGCQLQNFAHDKNGPDAPHVRWQTSGKNNEVGHIILDEVPAGRSNNKLDRSQY